jgi:hypothetical protein
VAANAGQLDGDAWMDGANVCDPGSNTGDIKAIASAGQSTGEKFHPFHGVRDNFAQSR